MGIGKCWNYRLQLITIMLSVMLIMLAGNRKINALEATGENKGVGEFDIQKEGTGKLVGSFIAVVPLFQPEESGKEAS